MLKTLVRINSFWFLLACGSGQVSPEDLEAETAVLGEVTNRKDNTDKFPSVSKGNKKGPEGAQPGTENGNSNSESEGSGNGGGVTLPEGPNNFNLHSPSSAISNNASITIRFTDVLANEVYKLFDDSSCTNLLTEKSAVSEGSLDIDISMEDDALYNFYAKKTGSGGVTTDCSSHFVIYKLDRAVQPVSSIRLSEPASSPANDLTPTIHIAGQDNGDIVNLYTNSNCLSSSKVGFATVSENVAAITLDPGVITGEGGYTFYGKSSDPAGNQSACSTASLAYVVDLTPPNSPDSATVITSSPNTVTTPSLSISGVMTGDRINVYTDADCDTKIADATASSNPQVLDVEPLTTEGSYQFYVTASDVAGNSSACAGPSNIYMYDAGAPTLSSVSISGPGGSAIIGNGGTVIIDFTASESLVNTSALVLGNSATVAQLSGLKYRVSYPFASGDTAANPVTFSIDYQDAAGNAGVTVTSTSDNTSVEYDPSNFAPVISLSNQSVAENATLSFDINDTNSNTDTDGGGEPLSYTCFYDQVVDGNVALNQTCNSLGASFISGTGVYSWIPDYEDSGIYELRIIASDGNFEGELIASLEVTDTNRAPVIAAVADAQLNDGESFSLDFNDSTTGDDIDIDGDILSWSCSYDDAIDGTVAAGDSCSNVANLNFSATTGQFSWTVAPNNVGDYEFEVRATDGSLIASTIFSIQVIVDISLQVQIAMVGNDDTTYVSSLGDNNEVKLNDVVQSTYQTGDTFTLTTSQGDKLECSQGCFAITPTQGTAAWATQTYASTLLSTYIGREVRSRVVIVAFDYDAYVEIKQYDSGASSTVVQASGTVAAGTAQDFSFTHIEGALWIESNQDIAAYIVTGSDPDDTSTYDRDGRIITAAAKQNLAFVSGGGGTPSGITTTEDNATVYAYRNDGTNFASTAPATGLGGYLDITEVLDVTSSQSQNAALSAIAIYADKKVVSTQHADSDGNNATPSLPKSMLSTHFVAPMNGDYVSVASFEAATLTVIKDDGTLEGIYLMGRDASADPLAPYAYSFNPSADFNQGYQFRCSKPCMGIFEAKSTGAGGHNIDDETLMTGTLKDPFSLQSASFSPNQSMPISTGGNAGSCSGENDFPNLNWNEKPWGTQAYAIVVENLDSANFVHLNLVDVDKEATSIPAMAGNSINFSTGITGDNGYNANGWSGPCGNTGDQYQFTIYALSDFIGVQVNNLSSTTFEATYSNIILDKATLIGLGN